jgi:hypothetical protein
MEAASAMRVDTFLERRFAIGRRGSNGRVEVLGGVSTFVTGSGWLSSQLF